ncbi:uncharacterized protein KD926_009219 [Aspergillus affinis]|uniref:uncharacterized protein n=1 Tax=Aspergillus affinis TaxID=1070780 RepID=UPI0022FDBB3B|nr:uncharacterized protein KD926_009219 [Aspergillus affinis]KAI9039627.1 hypothetical protein KD926_009219 [Aspergillus affinis]
MSTTTTTTALTSTTLVGMLPTFTDATALVSGKNCPTCGQEAIPSQPLPANAQKKVHELEGHIECLNVQAAHMAEKLAEYEEQVRRLRAQAAVHNSRNGSSVSSLSSAKSNEVDRSLSPPQSSHSQTQQGGRLSTLTSLLHYRRPSASPATPPQAPAQPVAPTPPSPPQPPDHERIEWQNALNREQNLRREAESQLMQANAELEELTAQLFSQANEMVAQERRARAKLEERVALLERRDVEKRNRLERLEKAMERVERIRALVG